jgi:vitamin B12 transporter
MNTPHLRRAALLSSAAITLLAASQPAFAQNEPSGAIVVLGDKLEESLPEKLKDFGNRLETVDGEQIDAQGYDDTAQALQMSVPGLYIAPQSGAFDYANISLLGSRTSEVLFLVDGVRINNRLYTTTPPLDTLPSSMIERVEILKGGQGLFYGTQSVGGIVNVITKGFTSDFDGALEAGYDTNEGYHFNGYVRGGGSNHYFVAYGSYDRAEGYQPFRDADYQPSGTDRKRGYEVGSGGIKYAFEPSDAFRLSASYQHTEGTVEFAKAEDTAIGYNTRNEEIASLKIDWTPSDKVGLFVKGYWHEWDSTYTQFDNILGVNGQPTGALDTIDDHDPWVYEDRGINVLGEFYASDALTVAAGYDYQKYDGMDAVFLIGQHAEEVHAPFAQVRLDMGGVKLAAGIRHNMPSDGQNKTVWNVGGRAEAGGGWYVRGSVGTSFRLPDAYELYVIDPCCETGNPNLVGEGSFNMEAGVGFEDDTVSAELMGFHRKVKDLIDITYDLPAYPDGFLINTSDKTKVWGLEAVVQAQVSRNFGLVADYTHTVAEVVGTSQQIQDVPRDQAKLILTAQNDTGRFGGSFAVNWVGDIVDSVSSIGRVEHGNYLLADLSAYVFLDMDHHHRFGVRLENIFDTEYATRVIRVRRDSDSSPYPAENLGPPLTAHVTYQFRF